MAQHGQAARSTSTPADGGSPVRQVLTQPTGDGSARSRPHQQGGRHGEDNWRPGGARRDHVRRIACRAPSLRAQGERSGRTIRRSSKYPEWFAPFRVDARCAARSSRPPPRPARSGARDGLSADHPHGIQPAVADVDRFVTVANGAMKNSAYTLTATLTRPRPTPPAAHDHPRHGRGRHRQPPGHRHDRRDQSRGPDDHRGLRPGRRLARHRYQVVRHVVSVTGAGWTAVGGTDTITVGCAADAIIAEGAGHAPRRPDQHHGGRGRSRSRTRTATSPSCPTASPSGRSISGKPMVGLPAGRDGRGVQHHRPALRLATPTYARHDPHPPAYHRLALPAVRRHRPDQRSALAFPLPPLPEAALHVAPMVRKGTAAKIELQEREDYVGGETGAADPRAAPS